MSSRFSQVQTAAIVVASACVIATVGGTAFATGGRTHARTSSGVSKAEVTSIVKSYIAAHKSQIQGPKPTHILFVTTSDHTKLQTVTHIGPFVMQAQCKATGVTVQFAGPSTSEQFGTNSFGEVDGGAGTTYETSGETRSFGVSTNTQGSQTEELVSATTSYSVTYFEQATTDSPVECDVVGQWTTLK